MNTNDPSICPGFQPYRVFSAWVLWDSKLNGPQRGLPQGTLEAHCRERRRASPAVVHEATLNSQPPQPRGWHRPCPYRGPPWGDTEVSRWLVFLWVRSQGKSAGRGEGHKSHTQPWSTRPQKGSSRRDRPWVQGCQVPDRATWGGRLCPGRGLSVG